MDDRTWAVGLLPVVTVVALALETSTAARAQERFEDWRDPLVVELELLGAMNDDRLRTLRGERIRLGPDESFTLEADPYDQRGRRFPRDRFELGVEPDRRCDGVLSVSDDGRGALTFYPGRRRGRCRVVLYVPGNLNLDHELEFEVTGIGSDNYTRGQAEEIARRLYRAILQREIEESIFSTAVAEIQRGRLENQVSSMIDSREFAMVRGRSQPADLLEAFYRGLLQRNADTAGLDDYLPQVERGRYRDVIMNLVQSAEFEAGLVR